MAPITMVSLKRHMYGYKFYNAGEQYEVKTEKIALLMAAMRKAVPLVDAPAAIIIPDPPTPEKEKTTKRAKTKKETSKKKTTKKTTKAKETSKSDKPVKAMTTKTAQNIAKTSTKDLKAGDKEEEKEVEEPVEKEEKPKSGTYSRRDMRAKE